MPFQLKPEGIYLALTTGNLTTGWILVALISLLLIIPINALLLAPRGGEIVRLARSAQDSNLDVQVLLNNQPIKLQVKHTTSIL